MQINCNKSFDNNGHYASLGKPNMEIIQKMLAIDFFTKKYPKSLDKLEFKEVFKLIEIENLNHYDAITTLNLLTTLTIQKSINILPHSPNKILVSGGGVHNKILYKSLIKLYKDKIVKSSDFNLPVDYIESELIAFLAARYMNKLPSTFPSTIGVSCPTILGKIIKTKNSILVNLYYFYKMV